MKLLYAVLVCTLMSCLFTAPVTAGSIIQDTNAGSLQIQAYQPVGQSFTATSDSYEMIGAYVAGYYNDRNDPTFDVKLFSGDGQFGGTPILTDAFSFSKDFVGWAYVDVSSISFVIGEKYTVAYYNDTAQWGLNLKWEDNPYSGGRAYFTDPTSHPEADLQFRVLESGASVPLPASLLLFGPGLVGLAAIRRRVKK